MAESTMNRIKTRSFSFSKLWLNSSLFSINTIEQQLRITITIDISSYLFNITTITNFREKCKLTREDT